VSGSGARVAPREAAAGVLLAGPAALLGGLALVGALVRHPRRWFAVLTWLLTFHILAMCLLFGGLGLPARVVRPIAAWKELAALLLLLGVTWRAAQRTGPRTAVAWQDVAVAGLGLLAIGMFVAANAWRRDALPLVGQLYGLRDGFLFLALYFVGRGTPELVDDDGVMRRMVTVIAICSVAAVLEQLFVPPELMVLVGVAAYFNDFLGVSAFTADNEFGLPANLWSLMGGVAVRRSGSVFLTSQGFAVSYLLFMPAATAWLLTRARLALGHWLAYVLVWVGLLLSLTRMTVLTCLIQVVLVAVLLGRPRFAIGVVSLLAVAVVGAVVALEPIRDFAWETLTWQSGSSLSHSKDWLMGMEAMTRSPLGNGLGTADMSSIRAGLTPLAFDNQFFKYGVELGIPGLLLFLLVIAGMFAAGWRALGADGTLGRRAFGACLVAAAVGVVVNGVTGAVLNQFLLAYLLFWMYGATVSATQRRVEAP
jgi:hypothetical protein